MNDVEQNSVLFFRSGKKYYYNYQGDEREVNAITFNKLKEKLILPYKVDFIGFSRAQVGRVVSSLYEKNMNINIKKINDRTNHATHFIVTFYERKNVVEAFKIPYINNLYGRVNDINPYTIIDLNRKKILLEVTKDFVKNNDGDYYFLASDLTIDEQTFFDNCYTEIEYDFLYNINNARKKTYSRKKK